MTEVFDVALTARRPGAEDAPDRAPGKATAVVPAQPTSGDTPAPMAVLEPVAVGDVLAGLDRRDFTVLAGFSRPGERFAAIDHVVVGEGGVFVLSVAPAGVALVEGGLAQGDMLLTAAADAAGVVAELLPRVDPAVVTAVVCLTTPQDVDACVQDVLVCSSGNLARLLSEWPSVMDAETAGFLGRRLAVQQQPVAVGVPAPARRRGLRRLFGRG
jgi:hypothetical protein